MSQDPISPLHNPKNKFVAGAICNDTPIKANSHTVDGHKKVDILRKALDQELDSMPWYHGGEDFIDTAFPKIATPSRITKFLEASKTYTLQEKTWTALPVKFTEEADLYPGFLKIMQEILAFFKIRNRKVALTSATKIKHHNDGSTVLTTSPDFVVLGRGGKIFKEKAFHDTPSYAQCVSPIEIKTDGNKESFRQRIVQVATYARQVCSSLSRLQLTSVVPARQCFIEQNNRTKVYSALITESTIQLLQFDRGGVTYSDKCNFHENPATFVRIILGLASDKEGVGFDTTIFWDKGKRWLRTVDSKGSPVRYQIVGDSPLFVRRTLCGRGTCCWLVRNPRTKEEYIVKEYWRSEEREPETTFLKLAKGLAGIAQIIAHEDNSDKTTAHLRNLESDDPGLKNRVWCRIILERYGKSLDDFEDPLQLLEAFRDIAAADLALWELGFVHRDVTLENVVLGRENASIGWRGILIDLDMAAFITRRESLADTNVRTGSRAFQSINVLKSYAEETKKQQGNGKSVKQATEATFEAYPHDFLDDLESLFYILCWICYRRDENGKILKSTPVVLLKWESSDITSVVSSKSSFLNAPLPPLPAYFKRGSAFKFLLESLQERFRQIVYDKAYGRDTDDERQTLGATHPQAATHMGLFVQTIDQAIDKWKYPKEETKRPRKKPLYGTDSEVIAFNLKSDVKTGGTSTAERTRDTRLPPTTAHDDQAGAASTSAVRLPGLSRSINLFKRPRDPSPSGESEEDDMVPTSPSPAARPRSKLPSNGQRDTKSSTPLLDLPKKKKAKLG